MSNRNTVVRTVRIDSDLDKSISDSISEKGISFNLLVTKLLTQYSEFDRVAEKLGIIGLSPLSLKKILNMISVEESETLGASSGFSGENAKQLAILLVGKGDLEGFVETMKLMEKYLRVFSITISEHDDEYQIILSHSLGIKWSHFLKGMLKETLSEVYGLTPQFEITETLLTARFFRNEPATGNV